MHLRHFKTISSFQIFASALKCNRFLASLHLHLHLNHFKHLHLNTITRILLKACCHWADPLLRLAVSV